MLQNKKKRLTYNQTFLVQDAFFKLFKVAKIKFAYAVHTNNLK